MSCNLFRPGVGSQCHGQCLCEARNLTEIFHGEPVKDSPPGVLTRRKCEMLGNPSLDKVGTVCKSYLLNPAVMWPYLFSPSEVAGFYSCLVPVVINGNYDNPYQYVQINGVLKSPRVTFDPPAVCLLPVPLWTEISEDFTILCTQYRE